MKEVEKISSMMRNRMGKYVERYGKSWEDEKMTRRVGSDRKWHGKQQLQ